MPIEKYNKNQTHWILIEHITFNSSQSGCHDLLESSGMWQLDWCSSGWIVQVYDQHVSIVYLTMLTHTHTHFLNIYIYIYICILFQVHFQLFMMFSNTFHIFNPLRHGRAGPYRRDGGPDQGDGPGSHRKLAEFERCACGRAGEMGREIAMTHFLLVLNVGNGWEWRNGMITTSDYG